MRRIAPVAFLVALLAAVAVVPTTATAAKQPAKSTTYLVLYKQGTSAKKARAAARRAGGRVVSYNRAIGLALVKSRSASFKKRAARSAAVSGVAHNKRIGRARDRFAVEKSGRSSGRGHRPKPGPVPAGDPFSGLQWDMQQIAATPQGSYRYEQGSKAVRVGIIDTGVDGTHPDIAPNFDSRLSRNFTTDDPVIDGATCEHPPSCKDPNNEDDDGHGTHVASTIGSPLNGIGMAGVAPKVDLVNLRAGQDSGFFFLKPSVDALTYAGDHGIDVVNMSYYIDPWLFNCASNPADTPEQQQEQRTIVRATNRALDYAHKRGVTLIAAEGNENTDLGHPTSDDTSPDYPGGTEHPRTIDNGCLSMPSEGHHVLNVSATGPTRFKAYYSNYGVEQTDVAAPGGDRRVYYGTPDNNVPGKTRILAAYPKNVALALGDIDANGAPTSDFVLEDHGAYYQYLQGTSMAAPHATGVAALIIARYGHRDRRHGGVTLNPRTTEKVLERTATPTACPAQNPYHYADPALDSSFDAYCEGSTAFNGFYGHGIVDALKAVTQKPGRR